MFCILSDAVFGLNTRLVIVGDGFLGIVRLCNTAAGHLGCLEWKDETGN